MAGKFYVEPVKRRVPWARGDKGRVRVSLIAANGKELCHGEALAGDPLRHIEAIWEAVVDAEIVDLRDAR